MKKHKLALIGCGYLNEIVAGALAEKLPEFELVGALARDAGCLNTFADKFSCKACASIEELLELKPDFVAEAASVAAVQQYAVPVLKSGASLVVLSIGAFANAAFYEEVKHTAAQNSTRVYIASGAVGGFDVLRTAALMGETTASFTSQKAPWRFAGTPLHTEGLSESTEPLQVFSGSAEEAIALLPTQVNVAVATALASVGPERLAVNMQAVPGFEGDEYKIEIRGEEVHTDLNIYSRTSKIAAWSVVAALQNAVSPIVF